MTAFTQWQNFYLIVGPAAGALIGLQFVVIALIAHGPVLPGQHHAGEIFGTPTIIHFTAVLLLAAVGTMPWRSIVPIVAIWALGGLSGMLYSWFISRRLRKQTDYQPEAEDWLFYSVLPLLAYASPIAAASIVSSEPHISLFVVSAAAILHLLIGIHNAWDSVTYYVSVRGNPSMDDSGRHGRFGE